MKLDMELLGKLDVLGDKLKIICNTDMDFEVDFLRDLVLDFQDVQADLRRAWKTYTGNIS